jgi:hypothetical protein
MRSQGDGVRQHRIDETTGQCTRRVDPLACVAIWRASPCGTTFGSRCSEPRSATMPKWVFCTGRPEQPVTNCRRTPGKPEAGRHQATAYTARHAGAAHP